MKKVSIVIILICVALSAFFYFYTKPPFGSFPISVPGGGPRGSVEYRKDDLFPGVYAAKYGDPEADYGTIHMIQVMSSSDEAKQRVRETRESVKKDADKAYAAWQTGKEDEFYTEESKKKAYRSDANAVYLANEDKPEDDYLVFVQRGRAQVIWANGRWLCSVLNPAFPDPYSDRSAAEYVFEFARNLSYAPRNTTPPPPRLHYATPSFYTFVHEELGIWIKEWAAIVVPLVIALPFLFVLLFRKRKQEVPPPV